MKTISFISTCILCLLLIADSSFATLTVTLTPTNISCFGGRDGAISTSVGGGSGTYSFLWSTGATTQNISGVAAGYYEVTVTDQLQINGGSANVTLTEPLELRMTAVPSVYNETDNISLFGACNGFINITPTGGITPYAYEWSTGQTIANLTNLCSGVYEITVTDANACTVQRAQPMTQPDKASWDLSGTANSNPPSHFIGTTDNKDLVFKTYNNEAIRIKANGDIKLNSFTGGGDKIIFTNSNGVVDALPITFSPYLSCSDNFTLAWRIKTSVTPDVTYICSNKVGIGTDDPQDNLGVNGGARFFNDQNPSEYISIGHNSNNPIINTVGANGLLINYNNGQDVKICTGNSGSVETGGDTYLATGTGKQVGIGTQNPAGDAKLHVVGDAIFTQYDAPFDYAPKIRGTMGFSAAENPDFTWAGNDKTGIFHPDVDVIGFSIDLSEKMRVHSNGCVGIGSTSPAERLQVDNGNVLIKGTANFATTNDEAILYLGSNNHSIKSKKGQGLGLSTENNSNLIFLSQNNNNVGINTTSPNSSYKLDVNGSVRATNFYKNGALVVDPWQTTTGGIYYSSNVGIGTSSLASGYILTVCGNIKCKKVRVETGWCDFVFEKDYQRMSLSELEEFLIQNKHLPEIPPASEIEKEGLDVGEMVKKQMQKLEELTLYLIDLKKENDNLKIRIEKIEGGKNEK